MKCPTCGKEMGIGMVCIELEGGGNAMKEDYVCKLCTNKKSRQDSGK